MTIKELRLSKGLTQLEAAGITKISLRSYKQYENDESKKNTIKYNYIYNELEKYGYIDEDKGVLSVDEIKKIVSNVLDEYDVSYCYLFGSYAKGTASDNSDIDLLVSTNERGMAFFGLAEALRQALHKRVDLLNVEQLNNNALLINEILEGGIKIYGKNR